jgi:hypothetical protein
MCMYIFICPVQVQGQYQVIPAYYDQTGSIVMGNVRGIGNGTPMWLVSPAPVIVNATGTPGSNMRLLGSQPQQIATPPASIYNSSQQPSLYTSTASNGTTISGKSVSFILLWMSVMCQSVNIFVVLPMILEHVWAVFSTGRPYHQLRQVLWYMHPYHQCKIVNDQFMFPVCT